ncbi:flagellar basal body rod protein FlgC [Croceicoccus estronivorus]|uniref:flagellar basal body rod protein FlgC n=1 Tax=Croceicoccus estronivorus TaxID=1172626 RepID=UPI000834408C|nr:flagellar basal body rod protein FlgC [Croceicoccus estronivorus]OCC22939.1 flagellar basal body rod protein FlgC [Croceicoccus estronivorus]
MEAMEISRSGLDVEWRRLEVIAQNLANMSTTRTGDGAAYIARRLVSGPVESFQRVLTTETETASLHPNGVRVYGIEAKDDGVKRVYEPGHPHADEQGFVTYPNISHAEEMSLMVRTSRAYEANLVAMAAAQQIYSSALQLGRQS